MLPTPRILLLLSTHQNHNFRLFHAAKIELKTIGKSDTALAANNVSCLKGIILLRLLCKNLRALSRLNAHPIEVSAGSGFWSIEQLMQSQPKELLFEDF